MQPTGAGSGWERQTADGSIHSCSDNKQEATSGVWLLGKGVLKATHCVLVTSFKNSSSTISRSSPWPS